MDNRLKELRRDYEEIEIPAELDAVIQAAKERAEKQLQAEADRGREKAMKKQSGKWALKGLAGAAAVVVVFTAAVNTMPDFAAAASNWPVVGQLVKVLQFTEGKAGGGEITDGSKMQPVVLKKEKDKEKIAISFVRPSQGEGAGEGMGESMDEGTGEGMTEGESPQAVAPDYQVVYQEKPYTLTFTVNGVRYLDEQSFEELKKSDFIEDAYRIITLDDSSYRFVLQLKEPVKYEVEEYADPAHIVLTLAADKAAADKTVYSVRTETYTNGEEIGMVEEGLFAEEGKRMLKESGDQFYLELGSLASEEEANKLAASLNEKYGPIFKDDYGMEFKVFVEKR